MYSELKIDEQRAIVEGELAGLERQHMQRSHDASKYAELVSAFDAGKFDRWDRRVVSARREEYRMQQQVAEIDVLTLEISIENAKARLEAFPAAE